MIRTRTSGSKKNRLNSKGLCTSEYRADIIGRSYMVKIKEMGKDDAFGPVNATIIIHGIPISRNIAKNIEKNIAYLRQSWT